MVYYTKKELKYVGISLSMQKNNMFYRNVGVLNRDIEVFKMCNKKDKYIKIGIDIEKIEHILN